MRSVCAFASDVTSVHCQESRLPAQTSIEPRVVAGLADEMAGLAGEREAESGLAILAAHACRVQTSDRARDQVFPRVVRPAAPPVHDAGSGLSTERDTCFVNIVRPHRTPWPPSPQRALLGKPAGEATDRNKCTLQSRRCLFGYSGRSSLQRRNLRWAVGPSEGRWRALMPARQPSGLGGG
jgi:hypothetical protein